MTAAPLETPRLLLHPLAASHVDRVAELAALPEITRYVGSGVPWSRAKVDEVTGRQLRHWELHGFGWRIAAERDGGALVGVFSLCFTDGATPGLPAGEHEIGWWVAPERWGRGYAREGAAALCDEAFGRLGAPRVVARILPANARSVAVAESVGLRLDEMLADADGAPLGLWRRAAA
jgi:RimJ/RimL family protein N-acetyltransferase